MTGKRVVVMIAMEEEAQFFRPFLKGMHELEPVTGVVKIYRGMLEGATVDICISGIGAVHAAAAMTATLLSGPAPAAVLSCGCSGAHRPEQTKGDIVVGASVTPLSAQVVERGGGTRQAGIRCSMLDAPTHTFEADPSLLRIGTDAAHAISDEEPGSSGRRPRVDVGVVGSADTWRQCPKLIADVVALTGSLCEEMEAHALAQVCQMFKVPFLAIKDIANSEIHPEEIQLDPTHSIVPEASPVGINAAKVTARAIALMTDDADWAPALAAVGSVGSSSSNPHASRKRRERKPELNAASSAATDATPAVQ